MKEIILRKMGDIYFGTQETNFMLKHINTGSTQVHLINRGVKKDKHLEDLKELAEAHGWTIKIVEKE